MSRTLSDEDVKAIADAFKDHDECPLFDEEDRHDMRHILEMYRDSTTALRKGVIGFVLLGFVGLAMLGVAMSFK